jgi:hypothetical protein
MARPETDINVVQGAEGGASNGRPLFYARCTCGFAGSVSVDRAVAEAEAVGHAATHTDIVPTKNRRG